MYFKFNQINKLQNYDIDLDDKKIERVDSIPKLNKFLAISSPVISSYFVHQRYAR